MINFDWSRWISSRKSSLPRRRKTDFSSDVPALESRQLLSAVAVATPQPNTQTVGHGSYDPTTSASASAALSSTTTPSTQGQSSVASPTTSAGSAAGIAYPAGSGSGSGSSGSGSSGSGSSGSGSSGSGSSGSGSSGSGSSGYSGPGGPIVTAVQDVHGLPLPWGGTGQPAIDLLINTGYNATTHQLNPVVQTGPVGYGDPRTVRFGNFFGHTNGLQDVLTDWSGHLFVAKNLGSGNFSLPQDMGAIPSNFNPNFSQDGFSYVGDQNGGYNPNVYINKFSGGVSDDVLWVDILTHQVEVAVPQTTGGTTTFSYSVWAQLPTTPAANLLNVVALDYNGDGNEDLAFKFSPMTGSNAGNFYWQVLASNGTGFTSNASFQDTANAEYNVMAGNFNPAHPTWGYIVERGVSDWAYDQTYHEEVKYALWNVVDFHAGTVSPSQTQTIEGNYVPYDGLSPGFSDWAYQDVTVGNFDPTDYGNRDEIFARTGDGSLWLIDLFPPANSPVSAWRYVGSYTGSGLIGEGGPTGSGTNVTNVSVANVTGPAQSGQQEIIWIDTDIYGHWMNGYIDTITVGFLSGGPGGVYTTYPQANIFSSYTGGAWITIDGARDLVTDGIIW